jgi:two-component system nitrate/nitrite response regulator NarL
MVTKILLVDDHALFREGLASLLAGQPDFAVIGEAGSVQEAIAMARTLRPDLVLMDFTLPDGTGLDATRAILSACPETQIVFLTVHEDDERLFAAVRSGARGYMLKNVPVAKLLERLRGLERAEAAISPAMTSRILEAFARTSPELQPGRDALAQLTPREMDVLRELAKGATNGEIAERLFIAENTVKNHVGRILGKLGLPNRRAAARFAGQHGLGPSSQAPI